MRRDNYITILGWMVTDRKLKGNALIIFAVIYGFSQDGRSVFSEGLKYLTEWTNSTRRGVIKILNKLVEDGHIVRISGLKDSIKFSDYRCIYYDENLTEGVVNKVHQGSEQSSPGVVNKVHRHLYNKLEVNFYDARALTRTREGVRFDFSSLKIDLSALPQSPEKPKPKGSSKKVQFTPPTREEVAEYCQQKGFVGRIDIDRWFNYYEDSNWMIGEEKMQRWRAVISGWVRRGNIQQLPQQSFQQQEPQTLKPLYHNEI